MISASSTGYPFASAAAAINRRVSAKARNVSASGDTSTSVTTCSTVIAAVPVAFPEVAVTVTVPLSAAVTSPATLTLATDGSELLQATVAPGMTCPCWSRTVAVSWTVSEIASRVAEGGDIVSDVATGVGGGGSVTVSLQASSRARDSTSTTSVMRATAPLRGREFLATAGRESNKPVNDRIRMDQKSMARTPLATVPVKCGSGTEGSRVDTRR